MLFDLPPRDTVKIKSELYACGYVIIDAAKFDAETMVVFGTEPEEVVPTPRKRR